MISARLRGQNVALVYLTSKLCAFEVCFDLLIKLYNIYIIYMYCIYKMNKIGMLLKKRAYTNTRGVGMKYIPPYSHTHRFHPQGLLVLPWMVSLACFSEHHCSCAGVPNIYCNVWSPPDRPFCDGPPIIIVI